MLIEQTAINFAANAFSAVFGLLNVIIFTRLFAPADFGTYVLGLGFATTVSAFLTSWLRFVITTEQSRGDGTDVRGIVIPGFALSCLTAPITYGIAWWFGLGSEAAIAALVLALVLGFFDMSQDVLRAQLRALTVMKGTVIRALLFPVIGVALAFFGRDGALLLVAATFTYLLATLACAHATWAGTAIRLDGTRLKRIAKAGVPLTISVTLLSVSNVIDRFIVAYLAGAAYAGEYSAGVDLVRQTLIIPAVSASAAFVPLAVQILANRGGKAARAHLNDCIEFLLAITLPACLGFAAVSTHIANLLLGPEFRIMAIAVMPIISVGVIFQILTQQYLHIGFLLSGRTSFYLINTASVVVFNALVSYLLIAHFGAAGAAWARLAAEVFGCLNALVLCRWAFPVPLPLRRIIRVLVAAGGMTVIIRVLDGALPTPDMHALAILIPIGVASYAVLCWIMDIARMREHVSRGLLLVRKTLAQ